MKRKQRTNTENPQCGETATTSRHRGRRGKGWTTLESGSVQGLPHAGGLSPLCGRHCPADTFEAQKSCFGIPEKKRNWNKLAIAETTLPGRARNRKKQVPTPHPGMLPAAPLSPAPQSRARKGGFGAGRPWLNNWGKREAQCLRRIRPCNKT